MTPYTIRERRTNIAAHEQAEAYPGQREKLLESLIASDRDQASQERERAAEARHGGHLLTHHLPARGWSRDTLTLTVKSRHYSAWDAPTMLPEAAFAWPIYNAVHALRYVAPDWPRPAFPRG